MIALSINHQKELYSKILDVELKSDKLESAVQRLSKAIEKFSEPRQDNKPSQDITSEIEKLEEIFSQLPLKISQLARGKPDKSKPQKYLDIIEKDSQKLQKKFENVFNKTQIIKR